MLVCINRYMEQVVPKVVKHATLQWFCLRIPPNNACYEAESIKF